jgi:hypothetical protein
MPEFVDKTGINKTDGSCCGVGDGNKEPDPTSNIDNCYHCTKEECRCENDSSYKEDLIKKITDDVLEE